jgi:hypothetical protein
LKSTRSARILEPAFQLFLSFLDPDLSIKLLFRAYQASL